MEHIANNISTNKQTQEEIDRLIHIGREYCDGRLSESLLYDILKSLRNDFSEIIKISSYLESIGIEIVSNDKDVEDTVEDSSDENKITPYDPSLIDISPKNMSLDVILSRVENDEIDLYPGFQRKSGLWGIEQKSRLIESLILRIPLPAFYFDGTDNYRWIVIDGLQRLSALKEFFIDKSLKLSGLEFLTDLNNLGYDEIPKVYLRRMKETQIVCYIINPGAPVNLKYNIFKRINTGGVNLEPQEIRHALYQGFAPSFLMKLADSEVFKKATGYSVPTERMLDREFVLRFIAFYELGVEKYDGRIDDYLNNAMEMINDKYKNNIAYADQIERKFYDVLRISEELFGKYAFRRMPNKDRRRTISKALFETWTAVLAKYTDSELSVLINNKSDLENKYMSMFSNDEEFYNSIGSGKVSSVKRRFEKIKALVDGVISNA